MPEITEIKYEECYVAFIDILGFRHLIKESQSNPTILDVLVKALNQMTNAPTPCHSKVKRDSADKKIEEVEYLVQIRSFSDNIVLFIPVASEKLSFILHSVRYVHDRMMELGFVIRGAVTIGDMYYEKEWSKSVPTHLKESRKHIEQNLRIASDRQGSEVHDSDILYDKDKLSFPVTLGPAMIEAYDLERTAAVYPRVIFSTTLLNHICENKKINEKSFSLASPCTNMPLAKITDFICNDFDGAYYFDFFHKDIYRKDTKRIVRQKQANGQVLFRWERKKTSYAEYLGIVKKVIEGNLDKELPEDVMLKYQWLKNYFNCKCDNDMRITKRGRIKSLGVCEQLFRLRPSGRPKNT